MMSLTQSLGSLSSDVFERRTSTGSGHFALLSRDFEQIFGQIVSIRIKTLDNINTVASRLNFGVKLVLQRTTTTRKWIFTSITLKTITVYKAFTIGSLSRDVFARRTSTGSEPFSLLVSLDATVFILPSVLILIETICPKTCSKSRLKSAKCPLPVDVRRSKTSLLKLPNDYVSDIIK